MNIEERLALTPVIPLIQANEPEVAVNIAKALVAGGLSVLEVVLRTPEALDCLAAVAREVPDALVGAGTVLSVEQCQSAIAAGADFIISPGLDDAVVEHALSCNIQVFPGVSTATEAQRAWNMGLRTVKFFPAGLSGGCAMLKALGSVFAGMKFIPTGGVSAGNLSEYLAVPSVLACGGSWLTPSAAVDAGYYDAITKLADEAVAIARIVRG